ncbi:hypothetical protein BDV32DRAFT_123236, partial [Aspergillus pseudonomiae]
MVVRWALSGLVAFAARYVPAEGVRAGGEVCMYRNDTDGCPGKLYIDHPLYPLGSDVYMRPILTIVVVLRSSSIEL